MYNKYQKKPSIKKGFITSISVSELVKAKYSDENDYYLHTVEIKDDYDRVSSFVMRLVSTEHKLPVGTYVSFRHKKNSGFKLPVIEVRSFCKTFTKEELAAINNKSDS